MLKPAKHRGFASDKQPLTGGQAHANHSFHLPGFPLFHRRLTTVCTSLCFCSSPCQDACLYEPFWPCLDGTVGKGWNPGSGHPAPNSTSGQRAWEAQPQSSEGKWTQVLPRLAASQSKPKSAPVHSCAATQGQSLGEFPGWEQATKSESCNSGDGTHVELDGPGFQS